MLAARKGLLNRLFAILVLCVAFYVMAKSSGLV
jgi:hypothetical protein